MSYAGAARLDQSEDKSKSVANLRPKLSSHERRLTWGRLLLMNKVSVLRFGDHLFSSALFLSLSYLTFMRLSSSTRSSDGAGRSSTVKGQGPVLCLTPGCLFFWRKVLFSPSKSGGDYASYEKLSHHQDTLNLKQRNGKWQNKLTRSVQSRSKCWIIKASPHFSSFLWKCFSL